jgi:hypothetical protein
MWRHTIVQTMMAYISTVIYIKLFLYPILTITKIISTTLLITLFNTTSYFLYKATLSLLSISFTTKPKLILFNPLILLLLITNLLILLFSKVLSFSSTLYSLTFLSFLLPFLLLSLTNLLPLLFNPKTIC